ncbi:hypothetical protein NQZ79_g6424 [Umbelopsis isabellina]|nr:hypothetical protein NQZ79_g6424 [Umbelopsis isabellina]
MFPVSPAAMKEFHRIFQRTVSKAEITPQLVKNNGTGKTHWRKPRLSLRVQADLRKSCERYGDSATMFGFPEQAAKKPLRLRPNKLEKHERKRAEREENIRQNMVKMEETIKNWREEKLREASKGKSSMPF